MTAPERRRRDRPSVRLPFLLTLPTLLVVFLVIGIPLVYSLALSMHRINMLTQQWIFVGSSLLTREPDALSVALGVIAGYIGGWYAMLSTEQKVKLDIVVEQAGGGGYKRIEYEGDVEGLRGLPRVALELGGKG